MPASADSLRMAEWKTETYQILDDTVMPKNESILELSTWDFFLKEKKICVVRVTKSSQLKHSMWKAELWYFEMLTNLSTSQI